MPQPSTAHPSTAQPARPVATRPVTALRIHCPVRPETLQALFAGRTEALEEDPALAAMLAILRDEANPLGDFGAYKGVVEIVPGWESFRPTAAARPTQGAAGAVSVSPTLVLTAHIPAEAPEDAVAAALDRIVAAHPWEVPVIERIALDLLVR